MFHTVQVGVPLPIWDQNKGNIMAAQAALVQATEESHTAEQNLTTTLATAYSGYRTNLAALEYYRKYILPNQVRVYRGIFEARGINPAVALADLVTAQQTLSTNVTTYLTVLGQLWTSVVSVADLLQTDDLFQLGKPHILDPLPDLEKLPALPCCHACGLAHGAPCPHSGIMASAPKTASPPVTQEIHTVTPSRLPAVPFGTQRQETPARLPDPLLEPPPPVAPAARGGGGP
jgi:cobalt-zinc-cadmium efflux system outer membrane protein